MNGMVSGARGITRQEWFLVPANPAFPQAIPIPLHHGRKCNTTSYCLDRVWPKGGVFSPTLCSDVTKTDRRKEVF
jgi:hypothetical protein